MNLVKISVNLFLLGILIGCSTDLKLDLPGGYKYYAESNLNQVIVPKELSDGSIYIPCNVEKYRFNEDFIVARQRAVKDCFIDIELPYDQTVGELYFWIIDVKSNQVFRALTEKEYAHKLETLNIHFSLQLDR